MEGIIETNELTIPDEISMIDAGKAPKTVASPAMTGIVLFGCMPGRRPATIPKPMPIAKAMNNSNIDYFSFLSAENRFTTHGGESFHIFFSLSVAAMFSKMSLHVTVDFK